MTKRVRVRKTTSKQTHKAKIKASIRFPEIQQQCPDCGGTGLICYVCNGSGLVPTEMALALLQFIPDYVDICGEFQDQYLKFNRS